jgi:cytochrome c oxidase cbb3-type subunit 4
MISIPGIVTAVLLLSFVGITIWAYGKGRRAEFERAARAPLEGDAP